MPVAINIKTGARYPVTEKEMGDIKGNPMIRKAFEFEVTEEPEEVIEMKMEIKTEFLAIPLPDVEPVPVFSHELNGEKTKRGRRKKKDISADETM